jgi:hypothetical protein
MGDQLQLVQTAQKWYAKPQVLVPAAGLAYMIYNKKTRKTGLYILAAGAAYVYYLLRTLS